MLTPSPHLVEPGKKVRLSRRTTSEAGAFEDKASALEVAQENLKTLAQLQEVLYAQGKHALLVVLQAMDAGGKDGTIRFVFGGVNPQGCKVSSFKVPTALELSHDYLWRIHHACPPKGMIGIFNRSHYESVLVERVKNLVPKSVWSRRFDHINSFEKILADEGTTILKFFLHISKDEQKKRLQARLDDPQKHWKFNPSDLAERERWDDYMAAFEEAIEKTSTDHAPWYIIPADRKWYRNWAVSDVIVRTMQSLRLEFPEPREDLSQFTVR